MQKRDSVEATVGASYSLRYWDPIILYGGNILKRAADKVYRIYAKKYERRIKAEEEKRRKYN